MKRYVALIFHVPKLTEDSQGPRFNKWELLAAIEALSIYILVRLDEGETEHNDFDSLLISAVVAISSQFARIVLGPDKPSVSPDRDLETRWKDWIFEESARRSVPFQTNSTVYHQNVS